MRVLDPKVKNPIYKLHDRASRVIGDGGVLSATLAGGVAAPMAAGILVDSPFALLSSVGFYGLITFRNYLSNTKSRTRVSTIVSLKKQIPNEYHYVVDPMIAEVFHCSRPHFDFKVGTKGYRYRHNISQTDTGRLTGVSYDVVAIARETDDQWAKRQAEEKVLKAGYGCKYCGERISAAVQLRDECIERQTDDDSSVQNALAVVDSKRFANEAYRGLPTGAVTKTMKELM